MQSFIIGTAMAPTPRHAQQFFGIDSRGRVGVVEDSGDSAHGLLHSLNQHAKAEAIARKEDRPARIETPRQTREGASVFFRTTHEQEIAAAEHGADADLRERAE